MIVHTTSTPRPHWFFEVEKQWKAFDQITSDKIEREHWCYQKSNRDTRAVVLVSNKTYNFLSMTETDEKGEEKKIIRGIWFYKEDDNSFVPYSIDISTKLEKEFNNGIFKKVEITHKPPRDVIMHPDGSFKQYRRTKHADPSGREVTRGWGNCTCILNPTYDAPPSFQVFGIDLEILMKHPTNINRSVPRIFEECINYLLINGVKTEGVFRLSGSSSSMEDLRRKWDGGHVVNLKGYDVHDVAGLLKSFIRELPLPLCGASQLSSWINAVPMDLEGQNLNPIKNNIKSILQTLPKTNQEMLKSLFKLLQDISLSKDINKMVPANLAVCWAPNIFRSTTSPTSEETFIFAQHTGQLVALMIEHRDDIFPARSWQTASHEIHHPQNRNVTGGFV